MVTRRDLLEQLQEGLLADFHDTDDLKTRPVIAKELRAVAAELESLPEGRGSTVDDLAKRRAQRMAEASGQ